MGQTSLRAPPPNHTGATLISSLALAGRVDTGALPFEQDCRPCSPNSTWSSPLSLLCWECVKNNHDNHHFSVIYKAVLPPQALCILPEAGPRALSRHQLIPLTHGPPASEVLLVPQGASEPQGCKGSGKWLMKIFSATEIQCNWVSLRSETLPDCRSPKDDFLPKLPIYLPSLPTELAGSLPPPPHGQELLESKDHV